MADSVTIAKAVIEVGAKGVEAAEDEIGDLQSRLKSLGDELDKDQIKFSAYTAKAAALNAEIKELSEGVRLGTEALKKHGNQQEALASLDKKVVGSTKNTGLAFLELSRAFEDAQYGLRGVLNNIPTTIQMFGGPAGLAAAVSSVAVAVSLATPAIQRFLDTLDSDVLKVFDTTLQGIKDKIESLEKKPFKLDADFAALDAARETLDEITKGLAAYRALRDRKTSIEQERGQIVGEAVVEHAGGAANLGDVIEAIRKRDQSFSAGLGKLSIDKERLEKEIASEEAAIQSIEAMGGDDQGTGLVHQEALQKARTDLAALNKQIQEKGRERIDLLIGQLSAGSEAARKEVEKMLQENAGDFSRGGVGGMFGISLGMASTEEITARRKERDVIENQARMSRLTEDLRKKAEKEAKDKDSALVDQLNEQGRRDTAEATKILGDIKRDEDKAKKDVDRRTSEAARVFGPKINEELQAAALNRISRGQQDGVIQQALARQVADRLRGSGVHDDRVSEGAAAQIVEKVLGGLRLDLQTEGPSVQEAAQNRLSDLLRKVQGQRRNAGNARQTEALAQGIEANSFAELGVQFSPEQSQAAAKKAVELAGQGVNANAALQMALQEQLGAMNALGNQLMQQSGMLQQFAQEFQAIRRGIQTRQRTAGKRG